MTHALQNQQVFMLDEGNWIDKRRRQSVRCPIRDIWC